MKFCCDAWKQACDPESDNEGYGRLITVVTEEDWLDDYKPEIGERIGSWLLPKPSYCPWCGEKR